MSPISQPTFQPSSSTIVGAANVKITNLVLTNANQEYSHTLQANIKQLRIKAQGQAKLQFSFVLGESSTNSWTIHKGCSENISDLTFNGTLYIQANIASSTIEIMELY